MAFFVNVLKCNTLDINITPITPNFDSIYNLIYFIITFYYIFIFTTQ